MTTFRDAIAQRIAASEGWPQDSYAWRSLATDLLAMPEMRAIRRALQEHRRMDADYWHPDEQRIPESVREWVQS